MFDNSSILITGGTGSFGNRFIRYIIKKYKPRRLAIFSRDELKQSEMQKELIRHDNLRFFLGDVRDLNRLNQAMKGIDFVVHAAALKQVPSSEYNPMETIKTNIYGAENIIQASLSNGVKKVIALSTDKAANPINLYGATKLVSDKLFVAGNNISGGKTLFSVVRYGNVAGSRGSVVPVFRELLEKKENKIPITDKNMTRFWITLDEGVMFVDKSFERMLGGEIYVPIIPSVRIIDLAKAMSPKRDIELKGIRPGEKIHEILCPLDDSHHTYKFNDHFVIAPSIKFFSRQNDYTTNNLGEKGSLVDKDFQYTSSNNSHFLNIEEIKKQLVKV